MWWEECGAGLDMQTGYEGEQGVVGRVWSRAGMQTGYEGEQCVEGRVWSRAGNDARHSMKEGRV